MLGENMKQCFGVDKNIRFGKSSRSIISKSDAIIFSVMELPNVSRWLQLHIGNDLAKSFQEPVNLCF